MNARLRNYLSCFGPQFVRGIAVLAVKASFDRAQFRKHVRPLPNFFEVARAEAPKTEAARGLTRAVWSAIVIAWILSIVVVAFIRLTWWQIGLLIIIVSIPAPRILLWVAAMCLPKQAK